MAQVAKNIVYNSDVTQIKQAGKVVNGDKVHYKYMFKQLVPTTRMILV